MLLRKKYFFSPTEKFRLPLGSRGGGMVKALKSLFLASLIQSKKLLSRREGKQKLRIGYSIVRGNIPFALF